MTDRRGERGFVLITAMVVLMIMIMLGLALFATVNVQTSQTGYERSGEAAFDLAESALQAEAYQVQVAWPGTAGAALPTPCNQSSVQIVGCDGTALLSHLQATQAGPEYAGATWSAQVIDDLDQPGGTGANPSYYSDTLLTGTPPAPAWDSNGDDRVWVRAQATVGEQTRTVVEQMVHEHTVLSVPDNTITAGGVFSENLGKKVMIQAYDPSSGLTGNIEVRCEATAPAYGSNCLGWSSDKGQLTPPTAWGTVTSGSAQTLTNDQINQLIATAQANGTYYPNAAGVACPPAGTAGLLVVADGSACPKFDGSDTWNAPPDQPGALVVLKGSISFSGNEQFYGVIYMANQGGAAPPCSSTALSAPPILTIDGNAELFGAVFVDYCGVVAVGESGNGGSCPAGQTCGNINFASNGLAGLYAADAAAPAQNTFRIIPNN